MQNSTCYEKNVVCSESIDFIGVTLKRYPDRGIERRETASARRVRSRHRAARPSCCRAASPPARSARSRCSRACRTRSGSRAGGRVVAALLTLRGEEEPRALVAAAVRDELERIKRVRGPLAKVELGRVEIEDVSPGLLLEGRAGRGGRARAGPPRSQGPRARSTQRRASARLTLIASRGIARQRRWDRPGAILSRLGARRSRVASPSPEELSSSVATTRLISGASAHRARLPTSSSPSALHHARALALHNYTRRCPRASWLQINASRRVRRDLFSAILNIFFSMS
jgi:hypothetical protein